MTWVVPLLAQCVMCARSAAAQNAERARLFNEGILVLLIPALTVFGAVLYLAVRRRNV
jgi:hypothetical protein